MLNYSCCYALSDVDDEVLVFLILDAYTIVSAPEDLDSLFAT